MSKEALAQPEQGEPVAYVVTTEVHGQMCSFIHRSDLTELLPDGQLLYTTPQQRKPLTDEQRKQMWHKANPAHKSWASFDWYSQGVADSEAAHGIKE